MPAEGLTDPEEVAGDPRTVDGLPGTAAAKPIPVGIWAPILFIRLTAKLAWCLSAGPDDVQPQICYPGS